MRIERNGINQAERALLDVLSADDELAPSVLIARARSSWGLSEDELLAAWHNLMSAKTLNWSSDGRVAIRAADMTSDHYQVAMVAIRRFFTESEGEIPEAKVIDLLRTRTGVEVRELVRARNTLRDAGEIRFAYSGGVGCLRRGNIPRWVNHEKDFGDDLS